MSRPGRIPVADPITWIATKVAVWATTKFIALTGIHSLTVAKIVYTGVKIGVQVAANLAVSAITTRLTRPDVPRPDQGLEAFNATMPFRQWGYGRCRISGPRMLWESVSKANIEVIAVHFGKITGVVQRYFHGDAITLTGNDVDLFGDRGLYGPKISVYTTLGAATETAFADIVAIAEGRWTSECRGDDVHSVGIIQRSVGDQAVLKTYPNGPVAYSEVADLSPVYDPRLDSSLGIAGFAGTHRRDDPDTWELSLNPLLCRMHNDWYRYGEDWDRRFAPVLVENAVHLDACDEAISINTVRAALTAAAASGQADIVLSQVDGLEIGSEITLYAPLATVVVDSIAGLTVTLTANLAAAHALGAEAVWTAAAGASLTQPRYTMGGYMTSANHPADTRRKFMEACDGWMGQRADGAWVLKAGIYEAPGADAVLPGLHILEARYRRGIPADQAWNDFPFSFASPDHGYTEQSGDSWRDEADIALNGVKSAPARALGWVVAHYQGRRLQKAAAYRARALRRWDIVTDLYGLSLLGKRWIQVQAPGRAGLTDVIVEVMGRPRRDYRRGRVTFSVIESGPGLYAVDAGDEGSAPGKPWRAPTVTIPAPSLVSVTAIVDGPVTTLAIVMDDPARDDLQYRVRVWVGADPKEELGPFTAADAGADISISTGLVPQNAALNVEVAATVAGETGAYTAWGLTVDTRPDADVPPPPSFTAYSSPAAGQARGEWSNPTASSFHGSRLWYVAAGGGFGAATDASGLRTAGLGTPDAYTKTGLSAGNYDLYLTAENSAGDPSDPAGPVTVTVA